jgi:uncharacterized protein (DUF362 family)
MSKKFSRRDFIKSTAAAVASGGAAKFLSGCAKTLSCSQFTSAEPYPVGITRGESIGSTLRKAVELSGGIDFICEGSSVLIKPNATGPLPPPVTTNPELIYELILLIKERKPARIIVGERTFYPLTTDISFQATGIEDAAKSAGAEVMYFEDEEWVNVVNPKMLTWKNGVLIPKILTEVDHFINVPVVKTHSIAKFTLSMKNFVGILHGDFRKNELHSVANDTEEKFGSLLAELNLAATPSLNILDATKAMIKGGPEAGETVETGLILASRNRVAIDAVAIALLKHLGSTDEIMNSGIWEHTQIKRAVEIGLGPSNPSGIEIRSDGVSEIDYIKAQII